MQPAPRYPIIQDIFEDNRITPYLRAYLDVLSHNNEPEGLADYWWNNGRILMAERKTATSLFSEMHGRLDVQLLKYVEAHPGAVVMVIQEGCIVPSETGGCVVMRRVKKKGSYLLVVEKEFGYQYSAYRSYIQQRELEGFIWIVTADMEDTALTLASIVYNSMQSKHEGLKRYVAIKPKAEDTLDTKYLRQLCSIRGIGEVTARQVLDNYGTPWNAYRQNPEELADKLGARVAETLLRGIGRL